MHIDCVYSTKGISVYKYLHHCTDGLIGLGVLGGAAAVGGVLAAGAVALIGIAVAKTKS